MSLPETSILRIKAATHDLVRACGGVVRAGEIAMVSKTEISRFQTTTAADVITIPAVLALEADCGLPLVTQVMADINGRRLSDADAETSQQVSIAIHFAELLRKVAELAASFAAANADNKITAAEADQLDRVAGEVGSNILSMRRDLSVVKASGRVAA